MNNRYDEIMVPFPKCDLNLIPPVLNTKDLQLKFTSFDDAHEYEKNYQTHSFCVDFEAISPEKVTVGSDLEDKANSKKFMIGEFYDEWVQRVESLGLKEKFMMGTSESVEIEQ